MGNEPEQLDREASLMLYASGEMSPEQRVAFEAQLASDAALAADLQRAHEAMGAAEQSIRALDERQRPPVSASVAVRRAERAMQQWAVDRLRAPAGPAKLGRRMPWWSYPVAAAAIVIISFLVWSGRQEVPAIEADRQTQSNIAMASAEALAEQLDDEFALAGMSAEEQELSEIEGPRTFFINPGEEASW